MAVNNGKKKSVLTSPKNMKTAAIGSSDIKYMASDFGFRDYLEQRDINIDLIPTGDKMYELFMEYLKSTGR